MARVIKLLWRLDYALSYPLIDKRGAALRILNETETGFFSNVGLNAALPFSFFAHHSTENGFRMLSLETMSMNGAIEWKSGTDLNRALQDDAFRGTQKIVRDLLKLCEIRVMMRAGVRVICLAKFPDGRGEALRRTLKFFHPEIRGVTEGVLGSITDVGTVIEGTANDNLNYRVMFGPYAQKNVDMHLQNKPDASQYKQLNGYDLFFDLDLYENNISFVEHSLFRWADTKVARAAEFLSLFETAKMGILEA